MSDSTENDILSPYERSNFFGHTEIEIFIRKRIDTDNLHHGWILAGPTGVGKATLGARIARAMLDKSALSDGHSLTIPKENSIFRQVAGLAHPDLFVARREWDEKKNRLETEISVERIRKVTQFLKHTASGSGARIAVVDAADDMNRNSANALLKVLEEPPKNTLLLLIAHSPGRLLPTIRSRCRMITLRPVDNAMVVGFVREETGCTKDEAELAARAANGCPGYALQMITSDGLAALADAEKFIRTAEQGGDFAAMAARFGAKSDEARWAIFRTHLLATLSLRAREMALDGNHGSPQPLLEGWETLSRLCARGVGLNLDRPTLVEAMGYDLSAIFRRSMS